MVERWKALDWGFLVTNDGAWVAYTDYATLEAENARLKEALRECVEFMEDRVDRFCGSLLENFGGDVLLKKAREVLVDKKGESK